MPGINDDPVLTYNVDAMRAFRWIVALSLVCGAVALAQTPGCTAEQARRADEEADHLRSWDSLYHSFLRYQNCDDGSIAEGYDDVVSLKLLMAKWNTLPQLAALLDKDKHFRAFVLKHISLTALSGDDLKQLKAKAVHHCPAGQTELCRAIRHRVVELEQE